MKYLIVDTWNGEGYSESTAFIQHSKDIMSVTEQLAKDCGDLDTPPKMVVSESGKKDGTGMCIAWSYDIADDNGAIHFEPYPKEIVGIIIHPNVNDYTIYTSMEAWEQVQEDIRTTSEDYETDEDLYGTVHHCMDDEKDWLLMDGDCITEKCCSIQENLDIDCNGGDGVESEHWKCKECGAIFHVPIEIVRDWNNKSLIV